MDGDEKSPYDSAELFKYQTDFHNDCNSSRLRYIHRYARLYSFRDVTHEDVDLWLQ